MPLPRPTPNGEPLSRRPLPQPPKSNGEPSVLSSHVVDQVKLVVRETIQELSRQSHVAVDVPTLGPDDLSTMLRQLEMVHGKMLSELKAQIQQLRQSQDEGSTAKPPSPSFYKKPAEHDACQRAGLTRGLPAPLQDLDSPDKGTPALLSEASEQNAASSTDVTIKVKINSASGLRRGDWAPGYSSDPFCICEIPNKPSSEFRTRTIPTCLEPVWRHEQVMPDYELGDTLKFTVWDEDWGKSDDLLGTAILDAADLFPGSVVTTLSLKDAGVEAATLTVEIETARKAKPVSVLQPWQVDNGHHPSVALPSPKGMTGKELFGRDLEINSNQSEDFEEKAGCHPISIFYPFNPDSTVYLTWEIIGIFILMADLVWIPMQVFDPVETAGVLIVGYVILGYWTLDLLIHFNTAFYTNGGEGIVLVRCEIAKKYLKGWFIFDFLLISLDFVELIYKAVTGTASGTGNAGAARAGRIARVTRGVRLLRLMRFVKLRQLLFAVQTLIDSEWFAIIFAVGKNMSLILMLNHLCACLWFLIGKTSGSQGWVERQGYDTEEYSIQYLASLHWSLSKFTPGSANLNAVSYGERIFLVSTLITSMVIATCFISAITSTMNAIWEVNRYRNKQAFLLKKFLKQMKFSRELGARITRYIECVVELRHQQVPINKVEYLKLLSGPLNVEMQSALYKPHLLQHTFFHDCNDLSKSTMRRLSSLALQTEHYAKTDTVFERGTPARHLRCITKGALAYSAYRSSMDYSKRCVRIDIHEWCCEAAMWIPWKHRGCMKGLTDCEMILLHVEKFVEIIRTSKRTVYELARDEAITFAIRIRCYMSFGRGYVHDVSPNRMAFLLSEEMGSKTRKDEIRRSEELEMALIDFSDSESESELAEEQTRSGQQNHTVHKPETKHHNDVAPANNSWIV